MAQTTTSTLQYSLPSEHIVVAVVQEARPFNVCAPLVLNEFQPAGEGKTWQKVVLPTTAAASVSEGSDITAAARTTTRVYTEIAEVGLSTELTKLAEETSRLANQVILWAESQGRAIAQKVTADICALFPDLNGASAIGTTDTNIAVSDFVEAMYTLDSADAPGQRRCVLHPRQVADLFTALTGSGAIYQNLPELIRSGLLPEGQPSAGFAGHLFGIPVYQTTEVDLANGSADRCGAMFVEEAMAFVQLRPITVEYDYDASKRAREIVVTAAYGVCEVIDGYGVPIVTDA
ncbi:MAG: hypothetical protein HQ546_01780 [Planctomycetes bacterium]|nr:hypothetical protein [Planctomycetota bacterium]